MPRPTLVFLVTEDRYFVSHRLTLARTAVERGYRVVVATRDTGHVTPIQQAGCEVARLRWRRDGGLMSELATLVDVVRLYRRERPSVVHHVALKPIIMGSVAATLARVPKIVNAVAGLGYAFTQGSESRRGIGLLVRFLLRGAMRGTTVILQNEDDKRELLDLGLLRNQQIVIIRGMGVDLRRFAPTAENDGTPAVVFVARMLWDKGVGEFVEAARRLKHDGIKARFVLIGGSDPANRAAVPEQQMAEWVREGMVEWLGHRSDLPSLLADAHIVCLPSYREGLPKALVEAAAAGRPIVTTDVPGCRDVVRHEVNGLLVPPRDAMALASAIRRLLGDPKLRADMGCRGREIAEREFDARLVANSTLDLYAATSRSSHLARTA